MQERPSSNQNLIPETEPTDKTWTPQTAIKLLFLSFRHSQGSPVLQQWIFDYVRCEQGQLPVPDMWQQPILNQLSAAIRRYLHVEHGESSAPDHKQVSTRLITSETLRAYQSMKTILTRPTSVFARDHIIYMLTIDMLQRESIYVVDRNGRPQADDVSDSAPYLTNPPFSYLRFHALEGHSTGIAVFDAMYADIRELIHRSYGYQTDKADTIPPKYLLVSEELELLEAITEP